MELRFSITPDVTPARRELGCIMQKPLKKPSPDFPLTPHQSGYWVKKIKGHTHYIGTRWATPAQALEEWFRVCDALMLGEPIKPDVESLSLKDAMNYFLCDRLSKVERGELVERTYLDYKAVCQHVVKVLGASTPVASLGSQHFAKLRESFPGSSPNTIANQITRTKAAFNFLSNEEYVDKPFRFGSMFKKPSALLIRKHRNSKPKKLFKVGELRLLVGKASPQLSAMILLGVNAGFGNADCGNLPIEKLDLVGGWHNFGRPKTGIERRAWLWPETVEALQAVIGERDSGLVFVTKYGQSWTKDKSANPISAEFRKLSKEHGVKQTFYSLRHTFETIAGDSRDQVAVDSCMGHVPTGMSATYRENIPDQRLRAVCETVRIWYLK